MPTSGRPSSRAIADDLLVALVLHGQAVLLHLEVDVVGAERGHQLRGVSAGQVGPVVDEVLAEARLQATGERDHALAVLGELGHVHRRLAALVALQEARRGELDQVAVAGGVGGQQREVEALQAPRAAARVIVDDVDLAADDRLDAVLATRREQLDRAVHHAVIGQAQRRLLELGGACRERVDLARPVEQRVLGMDVEMGAGGGHLV